MKNSCALLCLFLVLAPLTVSAQGRHGRSEFGSSRGCLMPTDLELTTEQRAAVQKIETQYGDRINQLQNKIMGKRLEVQRLFGDPRTDERIIRSKAAELSELQGQSLQTVLDYRLAMRALLTPEQLRTWSASMGPCFRWRGGRQW